MSKNILNEADGMRPMIILPPGNMSAADIKVLNDNGICVVVSKNPAAVKFVDPIPSSVQRTKVESAAIQLSRKLLAGQIPHDSYGTVTRQNYLNVYIDCLTRGTILDPNPTQEEREAEVYDEAKYTEIRKLAREDAKAQRDAKRKASLEAVAAKNE